MMYAPDLDPMIPGVIVEMSNMVPTNNEGFRQPYDRFAVSANALAATPVGAYSAVFNNGAVKWLAGTPTKLYQLSGVDYTAWFDVTRGTAPGAYTSGTKWNFAQYGDVTIACNKEDSTQHSSGAGGNIPFTNLTGAPRAVIPAVSNECLVLFNYNDGTETPDGWFSSKQGDYTSWTTTGAGSIASSGRLRKTPGAITAAVAFGEDIIAFKKSGMYVGQYVGTVGSTFVGWSWRCIDTSVGCISQNHLVEIDNALIFVSERDIYIYDGGKPSPITDGVKNAFFHDLGVTGGSLSVIRTMKLLKDDISNVVYFMASGGTFTPVYNYKTGKWGQIKGYRGAQESIAAVFSSTEFQSIALPGIATNAIDVKAFVFSGLSLYNIDTLKMATGTTATFRTGFIGDPKGKSLLSRLFLRFTSPFRTGETTTYPAAVASVTADINSYDQPGGAVTGTATAATMKAGNIMDAFKSGRFLSALFTITASTAERFEFLEVIPQSLTDHGKF